MGGSKLFQTVDDIITLLKTNRRLSDSFRKPAVLDCISYYRFTLELSRDSLLRS